MSSRHLIGLVVALVVWIPSAVRAQPLADRVPGEAIIYVGWAGSQHLGASFEQSHLKAILDSSNLGQLFEVTLPGAIQRIGRDDKKAAEVFQVVSALASPMWKHPTAFYFEGIDWANEKPMPKGALLCRAGADADSLMGIVNTLLNQAPEEARAVVKAFKSNDLVAVTFGYKDEKAGIAEGAKSLSAAAAFRGAMGQVQKEPVSTVYVNVEKLVGLIDHQVEFGGNPEGKQYWPRFREALGLGGLKRFISTGGFDGKEWMTQCFVEAPAPRSGLLAMIDREAASEEILRAVPNSAVCMTVGRFDLAKLVREVRAGAGKVDNLLPQIVDMGLGAAQLGLGLNIQSDLLEPLGDEWALFIDPSLAGRGPQGITLVNRLRKPEQALRAFKKTELFLDNAANGQLIRQKMRLTFDKVQSGGLDIHYVQTPLFSPSWTVSNGNLIAALYPQTVAAVGAATSEKGNSILDNEKFVALRKRLGVEKASGIAFTDLSQTVDGAYPMFLGLSQVAVGIADMAGVKTPPMVLPPLPVLKKHLGPAGSASWTDEKGWHLKSVSPFPGSAVLSIDQTTVMFMAAMGGAAAQSRTVRTAPEAGPAAHPGAMAPASEQLKQIGMAAQLHANANRGAYPKDLGTLYLKSDLPLEVVVGPNAAPVPPRVSGAKASSSDDAKEDAAWWINENSTFVYLGQSRTEDSPGTAVLAHTKPGVYQGKAMDVLLVDGRVEHLPIEQALERMKK